MLLDDKVVIITGGAGLIGKEFIKAVIQQGGTGIIADINEDASKKAVSDLSIELKTNKIGYAILNITSKDSISSLIDEVIVKYGKIDALVNNAYPRNKNYGRAFEKVEYEDFCENVSLHLGGYFLMSQQFAIFFKKQGYGNIINISSIYGVVAPRFDVYEGTEMTMPIEYAVIKSAIIHMTKYMTRYFINSGIRFNNLCPGGIFDNQDRKFVDKYRQYSANKGMLDKQDLIGSLIYLLSDFSQFVNGQTLIVDDGWSL